MIGLFFYYCRVCVSALPDHVDAIFDYSLRLLDTELEWINTTLDFMQSKP